MYTKIQQEFIQLTQEHDKTQYDLAELHPSACLPLNIPKNRYTNVLPVETTRVRLEGGEDYINANFVNFVYEGGESVGNFVCTQAPLETTFCHFWNMVWELKCPVICSLNRLIEGHTIKGHLYWPDEIGTETKFGNISVIQKSNCILPEIEVTIRRFKIQKGPLEREIFQLHYTGWPDFGVPLLSVAIRELVHLVAWYKKRGLSKCNSGPPIVHCSAGIGRTGSFLALYFIMTSKNFHRMAYSPEFREYIRNISSQNPPEKIDAELHSVTEKLGVYDIVAALRYQRNQGTVQNLRQYGFIYSALRDELRIPCRPSRAVRTAFEWHLRKKIKGVLNGISTTGRLSERISAVSPERPEFKGCSRRSWLLKSNPNQPPTVMKRVRKRRENRKTGLAMTQPGDRKNRFSTKGNSKNDKKKEKSIFKNEIKVELDGEDFPEEQEISLSSLFQNCPKKEKGSSGVDQTTNRKITTASLHFGRSGLVHSNKY